MRYAAPVRRELGVRTMFNLLGPLTNPANAKRQVMGVFDKNLTSKLAKVLQNLGSVHVLVVHGADGMDEISFTGDTFVAELKDGKISEYTLSPAQFGMQTHDLKSIKVENAEVSKAMILDVFAGKAKTQNSAARDIVLLNAGAAIYTAGLQANIHKGVEHAAKVIDSGQALAKLNALKAMTNKEMQ